jgi:DNA polymerase III alpha subunit (gram-positive type)
VRETKICFFDLETTGLDPTTHEIIEIAWIITDLKLTVLNRQSHKVKPDHLEKASKQALEVNGYTPIEWANALDLRSVLKILSAQCPYGESMFAAGHNVIGFDLPFLRIAYKQISAFCPLSYRAIDTLPMAIAHCVATQSWPIDFKLESLAKHMGIEPVGQSHRAATDVEMSFSLFKVFTGLYSQKSMLAASAARFIEIATEKKEGEK